MAEKHLDACLRIVSDRHRRRVISRLCEESNGKTTIETLIDQLQSSDSPSTVARLDRDQLAIQLAHKHLLKLADHGIVEVDPETDIVRYQPDEQIEAVWDSLLERVA
ncbi:DUF7344 domain-containing protein [Natronococcus roseus]|uniref:DUF7344 domain-containing protein n=1 Tax=Natronococcus roseus TaxID=1052014 RepID=UPI00374CC829